MQPGLIIDAQTPALQRTIQAMALALVLAGFPLVATISEISGVVSTPLSIGMRAFTAFLAALLIAAAAMQKKSRLRSTMAAALAGFWLLYIGRMVSDTTGQTYSLLYEPSSYWLWAVGGCILPLTGFARSSFHGADGRYYFRWCFLLTLAAVIMALPYLSTTIVSEYGDYEGGRALLTALNPISLGHLGAQIMILGLWALLLNRDPSSLTTKLLFVAAVAMGGYVTLAANSRGPLVATFAVILFAILTSKARNKYLLLGLAVFAIAGFAPMAAFVDQLAGTQIYDRLLGQSQIDDVNTQSRFDLYSSALRLFADYPLTGSGLEDPSYGGYPHNLVVEAFMATGIFGGLFMIAIHLLVFLAAFHVVRSVPTYGWLALLTLQQLVGGQFSGSIAQATTFWGLVGALMSVSVLAAARSASDKAPPLVVTMPRKIPLPSR